MHHSFRRRLHTVALAACAAAQAPAQAQVGFVLSELGFSNGAFSIASRATAISDSGLVVGQFGAAGSELGFLWNSGYLSVIEGTAAQPRVQAVGVNNSAQVLVNVFAAGSTNPSAAVWTNSGNLALLPAGDSGYSRAFAINASGAVSGQLGWDGGNSSAALWSPSGAALPLPAHQRGFAWGLNNRGLVVGEAGGWAASWQDGVAVPLAAAQGQEWSTAYGVNDRGQIVGGIGLVDGGHAALWHNGQVRVLAGSGTDAIAVNAVGQVLGLRSNGTRFLWSEAGGVRDVGSIAGIGAGFEATALNALGQMVGQQGGRAVLYTPGGTLNWQGTSGASLFDGASWDSGIGLAPSRLLDLVIAPAVASTAVATAGFLETRSLRIGGGVGAATLQLQPGAQIVSASAITLQASGTLAGDGLLVGGLDNIAGTVRPGLLQVAGGFINRGALLGGGTLEADLDNRGLVSVGAGQTLRLRPAPLVMVLPGVGAVVVGTTVPSVLHHVNSGSIAVDGGALQVDGVLRNDGTITLNNGHASFANGLVNTGAFTLAGSVQVDGALHSLAGASIGASALFTQAVFSGALTNDGIFSLQGGGRARFSGDVDGSGSFITDSFHPLRGGEVASTLRFEGTLNPGAGIGSMTLGNTELAGLLVMQLGAGSSDQLVFTGTLQLQAGSALQLGFIDGGSAGLGSRFQLFDFHSAPVGQFSQLLLPTLDTGLAWDLGALYSTGTAHVVAVPEPATWALLLAGAALLARRSRRQH